MSLWTAAEAAAATREAIAALAPAYPGGTRPARAVGKPPPDVVPDYFLRICSSVFCAQSGQ